MRATYSNDPLSYAQPITVAARPAARRSTRGSAWLLVAAAALILVPLAGLALGWLAVGWYGLILPGVSVRGQSLDWMTEAQAAQALDQAWNRERTLTVTDGARTWASSPAYFGLTLDAQATARAAFEAGQAGGLAQVFLQNPVDVEPIARLDVDFARRQLEGWAPQVGIAPRDAALRLEGDRLVATPSQSGFAVDAQETLVSMVLDPLAVMEGGVLLLHTYPVTPRVPDVSAALAQGEALLNIPVRVTAYDPITDEHLEWVAPRSEVATWLRIQDTAQGPAVSLDPAGVERFIAGLPAQLSDGRILGQLPDAGTVLSAAQAGQPIRLTVRHPEWQYTVQPGDTFLKVGWKLGIPFWRIQKANPGVTDKSMTPGMTLTIPSKNDLLPLPVIENKRIVISIPQQRMWVYENGSQIREMIISTGIDRSPTQPGVFQIQTHELMAYAERWDLDMPHWMTIYEAWPGFSNGIHGLPTLSNGTRLWANVLGRPASYGCIILNLADAEWLYHWAEEGVVVEIQG